MNFHLNYKPDVNCNVAEDISIYEVPVTVYDNRTDEQCNFVFYVTADEADQYEYRTKIKRICSQVGFSALEIGDPEVHYISALDAFLG